MEPDSSGGCSSDGEISTLSVLSQVSPKGDGCSPGSPFLGQDGHPWSWAGRASSCWDLTGLHSLQLTLSCPLEI